MRAIVQRLLPANRYPFCRLLSDLDFEVSVCSPLESDSSTVLLRPVRIHDGEVVLGRPVRTEPLCDLYVIRGSGIVKDEPWSQMVQRIRSQFNTVEQWREKGIIRSCLNTPLAQMRALDKSDLYEVLHPLGVPLPQRFEVRDVEDGLSLVRGQGALVKKPRFGVMGFGVRRLLPEESDEALRVKLRDRFQDPWEMFQFQEYVKEVEQEGTRRLIVVDDEVVVAARFLNPASFITNVHQGGQIHSYDPTRKEVRTARECARAYGIRFGSVDFIGSYVLEVNGSGTGLHTLEVLGRLHGKDYFQPLRRLLSLRVQ